MLTRTPLIPALSVALVAAGILTAATAAGSMLGAAIEAAPAIAAGPDAPLDPHAAEMAARLFPGFGQ